MQREAFHSILSIFGSGTAKQYRSFFEEIGEDWRILANCILGQNMI